jgi:hypothetical protein
MPSWVPHPMTIRLLDLPYPGLRSGSMAHTHGELPGWVWGSAHALVGCAAAWDEGEAAVQGEAGASA